MIFYIITKECENMANRGFWPKTFTKPKIIGKYKSWSEANKAKIDYVTSQLDQCKCELVKNLYFPYETHIKHENGYVEQVSIEAFGS